MKPHQPVRRPIRERLQQYTVHDAEHRRVRANAERECEHGRDGEAWVLPQRAQRIRDVERDAAQPLASGALARPLHAHVAARRLDGAHVPERFGRSAPRILWGESLLDELLRAHLEVEANLVVHVARGIGTTLAQSEDTLHRLPPKRARTGERRCGLQRAVHAATHAEDAANARVTAFAYWDHRADSARSFVRPARVSV